MAIGQFKDVESGEIKGLEDLQKPLIVVVEENEKVVVVHGNGKNAGDENGSIWMVLLCTFVAVCGSFEFGSCVGYSAPTQSAIREDLNLSLAEFSMFGSILTIGAMLGAATSGRIADMIGRKGAMRLSAGFCITGWLAVYFSKGALSLDAGRFSTGYGIGVFSYVVPIFIAEIAPKNLRGGLTTLNQLMIVTGSSVAFLIGTIIPWRALALTGLVPCIFLFVGLCFIPESPRWLAKVGLNKEFHVALRKLRGKDADITQEAEEIQMYIETLESLPKTRILDLFQPKYIRSVMIGVTLMVFQQFGGINGISFYASETFASAGLSSGKAGTIAYACLQVPITVVGAMLMDKSGRRPLIMVSATGTFLGCFLAGTSFYLKEQSLLPEWQPILAVGGVLIYVASFSIGMGAVPWVIMSEIFPINVKGVAGSFVVLVNWLGAWAVSYTFNFLMCWSSSGTFFIYSGFCVMTILYVAKFVPETKGKTLEEIQASINS
ncbi:Sugar transporter ERD6-like 16 [Hibiscus syriacus]|uniref:Sugar transporter ERD6-like 16 n=1 Tax=Hibiscus syriacus TaxID=106335 RepID=A0A6A3D533_HIBSY|nr:sugar transporter ERD6-like 16 isoform X1 [Hibiscus syriacus]KAE8734998.1 Sugar transporter ERD6-like 16 [Hibiscus syriacus]